jgi:predicted deacylase
MAGANRKGVISVMAELGGGGSVDAGILADTERGLRRILGSLGMLPGYTADAVRGTRELSAKGSVYCYDEGLFEPFKDIGDLVDDKEVVGKVHFPDQPLRDPVPVTSPYAGMVLCKRALGQVARGDAVFQIADDVEKDPNAA